MTLGELAFGCYIYGATTGDVGYLRFLRDTAPTLDLTKYDHRKSLLKFLNNWGCRQFAKAYHVHAAKQIDRWQHRFAMTLFPITKSLQSLTSADLDLVEEAYNCLVKKTAGRRKPTSGGKARRGGILVSFGSVGTAKILFALRPHALMPWDDEIRKGLMLENSSGGYRKYLLMSKKWLDDLEKDCHKQGFALADLPVKLGRPKSSLPKLIDEYLWVTMTRKCKLPTKATLQTWINWL